MRTAKHIAIIFFVLAAGADASAQWTPQGELANIPVIEDCRMTGGDIAVAGAPQGRRVIYYCQRAVTALNQRYPGAGHFYYVHEFGHHALNSSDEAAADCWAARQLSGVTGGVSVLRAAAQHFRDRFNSGEPINPRYGSMRARAEHVERCGGISTEPTTDPVPITRRPRGSGDTFERCMAGMRQRCINSCVNNWGHPEAVCRSRLCLPNSTNMRNWRAICRQEVEDAEEEEREEAERREAERRSAATVPRDSPPVPEATPSPVSNPTTGGAGQALASPAQVAAAVGRFIEEARTNFAAVRGRVVSRQQNVTTYRLNTILPGFDCVLRQYPSGQALNLECTAEMELAQAKAIYDAVTDAIQDNHPGLDIEFMESSWPLHFHATLGGVKISIEHPSERVTPVRVRELYLRIVGVPAP